MSFATKMARVDAVWRLGEAELAFRTPVPVLNVRDANTRISRTEEIEMMS
jgi:hypothetical protein